MALRVGDVRAVLQQQCTALQVWNMVVGSRESCQMCNLGLWMSHVGQSCLCQGWTFKLPNFQGKLPMTTQHERAPILDAVEVNDPKSFQPHKSY